MLLRCLLDTWDTGYYLLPSVLALLAWEVRAGARAPAGARACAHRARVAQLPVAADHVSADLQAAFFLTWSLALARMLAGKLLAPRRLGGPARRASGAATGAQEMTVSALSRPLSTS